MAKLTFQIEQLGQFWPEALLIPTAPRKLKKRLKKKITARLMRIIDEIRERDERENEA